jgi:CSLREA domain-containing protein
MTMMISMRRKKQERSPSRTARGSTARPPRRRLLPSLDALEERWTPAVFTVTTLADNAPGPAVSLREAIKMANQAPGPDTIDFAANLAGHKINLTQGTLHITDDLIIDGPSQSIIIDANDLSRIFQVTHGGDANITVELRNLKLVDGRAESGGAIQNQENLTLDNVILASNVATGGFFDGGGAIVNRGNLTMQNCSLKQNRGGHEGGALWNRGGQVAIRNSSFIRNSSQSGGALSSDGGRVTINRTNLSNNSASSAGGAVVLRNATLSVTESALFNNHGPAFGGAIYATGGSLSFSGTTLSNNRSGNSGSAIDGNNTAITLTNSTVGNNAGAAFFSGALDSTGGSLTLRNVTVAGTRDSAGIRIKGATLTMSNSIVADSRGTFVRDITNDGGTIIFQGNNLVEDGSVTGPGVITGNPLLGPLAENGGPTLTFLPQAGSPVIDAGDLAFAPNSPFDQRGPGYERIEGKTIDLGAVEVQA